MDTALRTIEANWAVLLALVVSLSVASALLPAVGPIVGFFRQVFKNIDNVNLSPDESHARCREELTTDGLYPELVEKIEAALGPNDVDEIAAALANKRLDVFWPNLRPSLLITFGVNVVFLILGVVVTLLITHPH